MHLRGTLALLAAVAALPFRVDAQAPSLPGPPLFTDAISKEEFAERRARVMEKVGDGVAVLQGATELPSYGKFRQNNQFFYLTGVEVERALVLIDGKSKTTTLFLPPEGKSEGGPVLAPGPDAVARTGINSVVARDQFARALTRVGLEGRAVYTPFRPEALALGAPEKSSGSAAAMAQDPWDGRLSREAAFIQRIRPLVPAELRNLDPILDEMRLIKSAREIELIREATRISGLALMEGIRSAQPGMYEYEIEAIGDYIFKQHNSHGPAYFAIVAAGRNASLPHYHASQSRIESGQLVLFDYAPDYKYYTADVTRMFPANGKFSAEQREMYGIYLQLYQALMQSIRPGQTSEIVRDVVRRMETAYAAFPFKTPKIKDAANRMVDIFRKNTTGRLGHMVGMEVHDVTVPYDALKPGMVLTIEPALTIPDEFVYIRLEDMILITPNGYENLSANVPMEIDAIERLMREEGMAKKKSGR